MRTIGERIKWARKKAGLSQPAVGRKFGISRNAVSLWESDTTTPEADRLGALAVLFRVSVEWLWTGRGSPQINVETTVVGYVGAGERVFPIDDHAQGAGLDTVEIPLGEKGTVVAVIVRGDSMEPTYRDGDLLFYAEEKRSPSDLIGLDCIVKVHEGPTFVKTIRRHQKRGHFTLKSYNAEDIGPVQVETAYPVRWIKRKV